MFKVETELIISQKLNYLKDNDFERLNRELIETGRMLLELI